MQLLKDKKKIIKTLNYIQMVNESITKMFFFTSPRANGFETFSHLINGIT